MKKAEMIIGTDFSPGSTLAVMVGLSWAEKLHCAPVILHCDQINTHSFIPDVLIPRSNGKTQAFIELFKEGVEQRFNEQIDSIADLPVTFEKRIIYGDPIDNFVKQVVETDCKFIVLALNNAKEDSFLLGSFAERIVRLVTCPVLIVKDLRCLRPKRITFPFTFAQLSSDAFEWVDSLVRTFNCQVIPLHVLEDHDDKRPASLDELAHLYPGANEVQGMISSLNHLYHQKQIPQFDFQLPNNGEGTKQILLNEIKKIDSDLVVMGTHARKGFSRLYLGSFCEFVLRQTPSSLLLTKTFST